MCQFGQARATTVLHPGSFQTTSLLSPDILQHLLTDSCTAGPVKWAGADSQVVRPSSAMSGAADSPLY